MVHAPLPPDNRRAAEKQQAAAPEPGTADAAAQLRALALELLADGVPIPSVYHQVIAANARSGQPVDAIALTRAVVGPYVPPRPTADQVRQQYQEWRPPATWRRTRPADPPPDVLDDAAMRRLLRTLITKPAYARALLKTLKRAVRRQGVV